MTTKKLWFIELKKLIDTSLPKMAEEKRDNLYEAICDIFLAEKGQKVTDEAPTPPEDIKERPMPDSIRQMVEAGITIAKNPPPINRSVKITEEAIDEQSD